MSKPARSFPRPLSEFLGATLGGVLKEQGFASTEIIARWADIVGAEIAAHSEPMKINWPRVKNDTGDDDQSEPATWCCGSKGRRRWKSSICRLSFSSG